MTARWVGFDMDECLGSFMPLWSFVESLPTKAGISNTNNYLDAIAKRIAEKPMQLFRPGIPELLRKLKKAQQSGRITGCFILTNNGSYELAETIRKTLNHMVSDPNNQELFPVVWYRYSPCRQRSENPHKDWTTIQTCLRASGLPTMSDPSDLLYYDDQEHVLASEIPYYNQVSEYTIETPVNLVYNTIKPVLQRFEIPETIQKTILQEALKDQDAENTPKSKASIASFSTKEMDDFVGNVGTIGGKRRARTRKMRKPLREKSRMRKKAKN